MTTTQNQNEVQNLPDSVTNTADAIDTAVDAVRAGENTPPYLKLGNLATAIDIGIYAHRGEPENVAQALGVAAAQGLVAATGGAVLIALAPGALGITLAGALVWGAGQVLDEIIDHLQNEQPDIHPDPKNLSNPSEKSYRIEYYDPLVLDLNGDGVINSVIQDGFDGVLFDHDGDGIKTSTGWVNSEDGFLVRDVNNNGMIDDGGELFGDSTKLINGENAENGFQALADYDSNGDKIVDENDINFSQLKIWKDLNQDGISTTNELYSLEQLGVKSLNVNFSTIANQAQAGGIIAETGSYTTTDNQQKLLADINFEKNSIYTKFVEKILVSDEVKALANVLGFGRLQNMQEAAMQSEEFKQLLSQYSNINNSRSQQKELIDDLIFAWAKTDPLYNDNPINIIRMENITWNYSKYSNNVIYLRPNQQLPDYLLEIPKDPETASLELAQKVKFVNAMLGMQPTNTLDQVDRDQISEFNDTYNKLANGIYKELLNQTILKPYLEAVDIYIKIEENTENLLIDYQPLQDLLDSKFSQSPLSAFEDLKDLLYLNNNFFREMEWDYGFVLFNKWYGQLCENPAYSEQLSEILSDVNVDLLNYNQKNQFIQIKESAESSYYLDYGDDTIIISKTSGAAVEAGQGNDLIVSGVGADFMSGGDGNNKYIIFSGAGHDFISYNNHGQGIDTVKFLDILSTDVMFAKKDNNLVLVYGESDSLTIIGAIDEFSTKSLIFKFKDSVLTLDEILQKTLNNISDENNSTYINGWRGSDQLLGNADDNLINGFGGNDYIEGGKGNDKLVGGTGTDLYYFILFYIPIIFINFINTIT